MNKKIIPIMLSVILALALTTSCGKKSTTPFTITSNTPATSVQTTTSKPPTSTSLTGAPTSSTPTTSGTVAPTTTTTKPPTISSTPTTSVQPTTPATITTTQAPTTATSAPPTNESLANILARASGMTNFQMDFTISGPESGSGHIWFMQNKMKMRMVQGSETTVVIVDRLTRNMQMYSETTKQGMVLPYQEQETPADDAMEIMGYNPRVLGTETVDGKLCTVIEYNDPEQSSAVVKAWVWNQYGFPIKMEITSGGQKITYLYQNITFNTVTAADFNIPAGIIMMTGFPTIPGM